MMAPRPTSPVMNSVCGRESSVSPPSVVAPLAIKPSSLGDSQGVPMTADQQQQRLLYQLALAERLRLASAGLAWARPPLLTHQPHHLQEPTAAGSLMGGGLMNGLGFPVVGGLGSVAAFGGGVISAAAASQMSPAAYPPTHPLYGYRLLDPRMLLPRGPEEPKPQHSYIGLIAMAILSSPEKKLILSDIYQYILDHYPYFRSRGTGWRNSIRHNLSLNDCFMKSGRSANGKGHYWAIHPANIDDFRRGDFRRRRAQRRVRKHMGLAVDDDSEPETLSPPPPPHTTSCHEIPALPALPRLPTTEVTKHLTRPKRQFDVLSLLAPDAPRELASGGSQENTAEEAVGMEVTSATDLLRENHLRVVDDLRLQVRDVSEDDDVNHTLHLKATHCLPLSSSEPDLRRPIKDSPLLIRSDEGGEGEAEGADGNEDDEEREEKCIPLFHSSNQKVVPSSSSSSPSPYMTTGGGGRDKGCLPPAARDSPSPLEYLSAPWHTPSSPATAVEPHNSNSSPIVRPTSPPLHYVRDLMSSSIRNYPANLIQPHVSKPVIQNLPSSTSLNSLNLQPIPASHGPNLSPHQPHPSINLSPFPSIHSRAHLSPSTSSTHHLPIAVSHESNSEIHTDH
ncbi:uncharacterized protein [Macrobrachium rosenbergii]|uniref:uncharacterized protein n=1 Tax=Macrobrachium rosenbergii TaxID=79674 RepID=UPI0034D47E38